MARKTVKARTGWRDEIRRLIDFDGRARSQDELISRISEFNKMVVAASVPNSYYKLEPVFKCMHLTFQQEIGAAEIADQLVKDDPNVNLRDLICGIAALPYLRGGRGRPAKWSEWHGVLLLIDVETTLQREGWSRTAGKGIRNAIAQVQNRFPNIYGAYAEETLRKAYYDASRSFNGPVPSVSGKSDE